MADVKLPFGVRYTELGEKELLHISLATRGDRCNCFCPGCGAPLTARKAEVLAHHFGHKVATGCNYQPEQALHAYAKWLIARQETCWLPELRVSVYNGQYDLKFETVLPAREVVVTTPQVEQWISAGRVRPDVLFEFEGAPLLAEVAVTSFVDEVKRQKLLGLGVPTVEIDMRSLAPDAPLDVINEAVLRDLRRRTWAYHPDEATIRAQLKLRLDTEVARIKAEVEQRKRAAEIAAAAQAKQRATGPAPVPPVEREEPRDHTMPRDDEDYDNWWLADEAGKYLGDGEANDEVFRQAPPAEALRLYRDLPNAEKVAYHCYVLNIDPEELPLLFTRREYGGRPFLCPAIVWRLGVFQRFVLESRGWFSVGDALDWCRERYDVFSFGDLRTEDVPAHGVLSETETEVYDFLVDLADAGYLKSDDHWSQKWRKYKPTSKRLVPVR